MVGRKPGYGAGGGGGITPIPIDSSDHYFEAELVSSSPQTFTQSGGAAGGLLDFDTYTEGLAGFFQQVALGGKHGLKALQNVLCLTYFEFEPTPAQTYTIVYPGLKFYDGDNWSTGASGFFTKAEVDVDDYAEFGPGQLIIPAGMQAYMNLTIRGLVADFTLDYADFELQVIGTF